MELQIVESREKVEDTDIVDSCDAVRVSVLVCDEGHISLYNLFLHSFFVSFIRSLFLSLGIVWIVTS